MAEEITEDTPENDFYKHLRDSENKLESEIASMPEDEMPIHQDMVDHLRKILQDVLAVLRSESEPDKVFAAAMGGLSKIQQEQFILQNILEAIKNGEDLDRIMYRFERLGLLPISEPATDTYESHGRREIAPDEGSFFMRLGKKLGKSSMLLANVAINAAKAAGKFVEVVPVIGFTGPFPTVSLQLQPKGASLDELFEAVMNILEQS